MRKASPLHQAQWLFAVGLLPLLPATAKADVRPTLTGRWESGPLRVQLSLDSWQEGCGQPPSEAGDGGGYVDIRQSKSALWIYGHDRPFSTSGCWEQRPGLSTVSRNGGTRAWSTTCQAQGADSTTTVRSKVQATDDTIRFSETSVYEFQRGGQTCTAQARRTRTYHLVERGPDMALTEPAAFDVENPAKESVGTEACGEPGPATILNVVPTRELVPTGGSVRFRVSAMDARGCALPKPTVQWALPADVEGLSLSDPTTLQLGPEVREGPLTLTATLAGMQRDVRVRVVSRERFESLLAAQSVSDDDRDPPPAASDASSSVTAGIAIAEDRARHRKYLFAAIAAVTATLLGALGAVIMRRTKRHPHPTPTPIPDSSPTRRDTPSTFVSRRICPTCGSMYGTEADFCGKDGSFLVQAN